MFLQMARLHDWEKRLQLLNTKQVTWQVRIIYQIFVQSAQTTNKSCGYYFGCYWNIFFGAFAGKKAKFRLFI